MKIKKYMFTEFRLTIIPVLLCVFCLIANNEKVSAQVKSRNPFRASEDDYYRIMNVQGPANVALEVSGMSLKPSGDLVLTTRFGEVWIVENPYVVGRDRPSFKKIASGLHTPLGITSKGGKYYVAQRTELTELADTNGDEIIDWFRTVYPLPTAGSYHEYVHGPILLPDGSFWVNMNLGANKYRDREPLFGEMGSHAPWKGWALRITPKGQMDPIASGMRSPAGMGIGADGTMYYSENQGGWVGTDYVTTVKKGDFFGHPSSLKSASLPKSNTDLRPSDIPDRDSLMLHEAHKLIPGLRMPSVRLPYGVMGTSASWILQDTTGGAFGPFEGQLFVADQTQDKIMRVFMEEIKGKMQGAAFQFKKGFKAGIIRSSWGIDGSMFVGMSDRGWGAAGSKSSGLQRLVWTGKIPFEVKTIQACPDGFELEFTKPINPATARSPESYKLSSFDYLYHKEYGSPVIDQQPSNIRDIRVSEDRKRVQLVLTDPLRAGYIYQITTGGVQSREGREVLHSEAFYSLNQIPIGTNSSYKGPKIVAKNRSESTMNSNSTNSIADQKKHRTSRPASWPSGPDKIISINAAPGITYDKTKFSVQAASKVKLVFNNPTDLNHNLVIVTPGSLKTVAKKALTMGLEGPKRNYIPESENVLFHNRLLKPGEKESIYFTAPQQPDEYPYVCTFPGHWKTMQGTMKVIPE